MIFKVFLLWAFFLIGRPQDLLTFLVPVRPALLITVVMVVLIAVNPNERKTRGLFDSTEARHYGYFFLILMFGIPLAYHRRIAFESVILGYLTNILFFYICLMQVNSFKRLKSFLTVILVSLLFYSTFSLAFGSFSDGRFVVYGTMFDPNDIAYVLISLFPITLFFILHKEGFIKMVLALAGTGASIAIILLSGSRAGIIGLGGVLLVLIFNRTKSFKFSYKVLMILTVVLAGYLYRDNINIERYLTLTNISGDYNVTDEFGRIKIWGHAWALTLSNPITGVGMYCFPSALGSLRDQLGLIPKWQDTHNSYIQVAVETGLIGLYFFLSIIVRSFTRFLRRKNIDIRTREGAELNTLSRLLTIGFVGNILTAFFLSQAYSVFFTMYFAFSAILYRLGREMSEEERPPEPAVTGSNKKASLDSGL